MDPISTIYTIIRDMAIETQQIQIPFVSQSDHRTKKKERSDD